MSDSGVERLWKLVKELRKQIEEDQASPKLVKDLRKQIAEDQGTSANKKFKGEGFGFNKKPQLAELQNKLGYKFKDEALLRRALDLFSDNWENDHGIFKMLGKSIMQTCVYYHFMKEKPKISKGDLHSDLCGFFTERDYRKETQNMGLDAFARSPWSKCRCNNTGKKRKNITEVECLYSAMLGAIAVDSGIDKATSIFLGLRNWNR